ncbi:MAG: serine hydrolase domain-containing protein [Actinocatenispora sp.]
MGVDEGSLRDLLTDLTGAYGVPGASAAVLADGWTVSAAAGVLNLRTGVPATADSLFQIGPVTKVFTTTALLRLVDQGKLDLDSTLAEVLPEFQPRDPTIADTVRVRHLLTHTSGLPGDHLLDLGQGDDVLERYTAACAALPLQHPVGATMSYSDTGFILVGRIIEVLTGRIWDEALRELVLEPLGLTHTVTLPERALLYRTAVGHLPGPSGGLAPVTRWEVPRTLGPAGTVCTTGSELLILVRLLLRRGVGVDGIRLLSEASVQAMHDIQVEVPNRWGMGAHWGLGLAISEWDGRRVYGHTGNASAQSAFLHYVPDLGVAVTLLANGGSARRMYRDLSRRVLADVAGVRPPAPLAPADPPPPADVSRYVGVYETIGMRMEVRPDGTLHTRTIGHLDAVAHQPPQELRLVPRDPDRGLFVIHQPQLDDWLAVLFYSLPDGTPYLHMGLRAAPKVAGPTAPVVPADS